MEDRKIHSLSQRDHHLSLAFGHGNDPEAQESGGEGEINSCTWNSGSRLWILLSDMMPVPFWLYFVLIVSHLDQDFWQPQNCWFIPFAAQVAQLFIATQDFGVLWQCCINLCALRMRQWRAQTFLCIVSNQIRVLFHLKMRAILEGKSKQKRK